MPKDKIFIVVKSFTDFYGNNCAAGDELIFTGQRFISYDGGHTLVFRDRKMHLEETEQREIIENFSDYLAFVRHN